MGKDKQIISYEEPERKVDAGEDIEEYLDRSKARTIKPKSRSIFVDLPERVIDELDEKAAKRCILRSAVLKSLFVDGFEGGKEAS